MVVSLLAAVVMSPGLVRGQVPLESAFEGTGHPGHGTVEAHLGVYDQTDRGDGNPFLDEALTVIEPVVLFDYDVTARLKAHGEFSYDHVSSASMKRLSRYPQQSGASGDDYFGARGGLDYQWNERTTVGGFLSGSVEYDYWSLGGGGNLQRSFNDHDTSLQISGNFFFDTVDIIRFNGQQNEGTDHRTSLTGSVGLYQVLDRHTHAQLGATFTHQSGFLETAFNSVVIEDPALPPNPVLDNQARGFEVTEELPGTRQRLAVFGKLRRHVGRLNALEFGGRYYRDSWGIHSGSFEPRLYRWIVEEKLNAHLRYRYYDQTAADDFAFHFDSVLPLRTQDSDLGPFHSNSYGLGLEWFRDSRTSWTWNLDWVDRSDGLSMVFGSIGVRRSF